MRQATTLAIYGLSSIIGLIAFFYPFFTVIEQVAIPQAARQDAPLLTIVLLCLCLVALMIDLQGQSVSAKQVATLGVLIAIASVLRFLETAMPALGGFSPVFVPIILGGYVFGARFGFLQGALTLFVSSLLIGGIGPWLPYQMFAAGWIGLGAGYLPRTDNGWLTIGSLAIYGFLTGLLYGVLLNLYFWPFVIGDPATSYAPGSSWQTAFSTYGIFYATTSFVWDLFRAVGNVVLLLVLGLPAIKALARFRDRFQFEVIA